MDILFLHCPSFYDFRKKLLVTGAFTDAIPNSGIYEMYPMGLLSMTATLQKYNYRAGIINIANLLIQNPDLDLEKYLSQLNAEIFGFDLHWMIHSQGVFSISKILKKVKPNAKIILGGFTASYFGKTIMKDFPQIDFILRGDTVEVLFVKLIHEIQLNHHYEAIPNLIWREGKDKIHDNPYSFVPKEFTNTNEDFFLSLLQMIKDSMDPTVFNFLPNARYPKKIGVPILFCKGCTQNCINCGASAYANKKVLNRDRIAVKPPEILAREMVNIANCYDFPLTTFGDFRIAGPKYVNRLISALKKYNGGKKIDNPVMLEIFWPADESYLEDFQSVFSFAAITLSPETGNDLVRKKQGRPFTNQAIISSSKRAKELGYEHLIHMFQIGNGFETIESLADTQHLCKDLLLIDKMNIHPIISPLIPYIDPGSIAYENPAENGYKLLYPTLNDQIKGFEKPIWKYFLNYETLHFNRDMLVQEGYNQCKMLNDTKFQLGSISEDNYIYLNKLLDISYRLLLLLDKEIKGQSQGIQSAKIKQWYSVKNVIGMKSKHDPQVDALGPSHLTHNGIRFISWRIKHLLSTGRLFYQ